jgi:hypothetical protein
MIFSRPKKIKSKPERLSLMVEKPLRSNFQFIFGQLFHPWPIIGAQLNPLQILTVPFDMRAIFGALLNKLPLLWLPPETLYQIPPDPNPIHGALIFHNKPLLGAGPMEQMLTNTEL